VLLRGGGVYWLSFAAAAGVPTQVAACGGLGGMELRPDFGDLSLGEQERLVRVAWNNPMPRLLVFDNCEDEALLARWKPALGGSRVLVTSRRGQWDPTLGVTVMSLEELPRAESIALLRKHRPDLPVDDRDLDALASELSDLPLALHLAGSYLARYKSAIAPAAYLQQLRGPHALAHRSLQGKGLSPTSHDLHVGRTFAVSYDKLDTDDPIDAQARAILTRAAYFAPGEVILREILLATLAVADDDPDAALLNEDALARLIELGLLEIEVDGALRLHRLLAMFVRDAATDEEVREAQAAVEGTLLDETWRLIGAGYPGALLPLQPHLRAATDASLARADVRTADLCAAMSRYLGTPKY